MNVYHYVRAVYAIGEMSVKCSMVLHKNQFAGDTAGTLCRESNNNYVKVLAHFTVAIVIGRAKCKGIPIICINCN